MDSTSNASVMLQTKNEELQTQVNRLEAENAQLKERVKALTTLLRLYLPKSD